MNFMRLDDSNIVTYAMNNYVNPSCTDIKEFEEDFNKFKYIKRLFNRYESAGVLRERLILNHMITLYNVFGRTPATRMLFNRCAEKHYIMLKTFLVFLNYCPEKMFDGIDIESIPCDPFIVKALRNIDA
tara:strand:- start:1525 stop:1911 length:387 start_codon:yes stop_codon:yes gene_type:complete